MLKTTIKKREESFNSVQHTYSSDEQKSPSQKEEFPVPNLDSEEEDEEINKLDLPELKQLESKILIPEKPTVLSSPLLLPHEKKEAKNLGFSLDTKLLNDEFFFIDLEKM